MGFHGAVAGQGFGGFRNYMERFLRLRRFPKGFGRSKGSLEGLLNRVPEGCVKQLQDWVPVGMEQWDSEWFGVAAGWVHPRVAGVALGDATCFVFFFCRGFK